MTNIIKTALEAVTDISKDSGAGLVLALEDIGATTPNLPDTVQRAALIAVIGPALERHPANSSKAYTCLHAPLEGYADVFVKNVAPTICNLFLFQ